MKKPLFSLPAALALVGLMLTGCGKDDPVASTDDPNDQLYGSAQTDEQFFRLYGENDEYFKADDLAMNDGDQPQSMDDDSLGKLMTPIRPLRWARHIRNFNRSMQLDSVTADSLAYVTITKTWTGVLLIAAAYSDTSTTPDTVIQKPFTTVSKKRIIFKRIGRDRVIWRNWRPVAVSLIAGGTSTSSDIALTQVKMNFFDNNGTPDSIVVTDPLNTFLRFKRVFDIQVKDVPEIESGRRVRLQVTLVSADSDTDHVVLRYGFSPDRQHRRRIRLALVSETFDGTNYVRIYERGFNMHFKRGVFSAAIDATTHGTLFDDSAAVASSFWGVPYMVTR
ncbi:MAG: hypothetical protein ACKVRP_05540 [Bacteroidota bacterium]